MTTIVVVRRQRVNQQMYPINCNQIQSNTIVNVYQYTNKSKYKYHKINIKITPTYFGVLTSSSASLQVLSVKVTNYHSVRIDNSTFERVEEFKYLGTNLTNQNSIAEEIKSRLRSGNACYRSVPNLLSSQVANQKFKDQDIQNYNFAYGFVWV